MEYSRTYGAPAGRDADGRIIWKPAVYRILFMVVNEDPWDEHGVTVAVWDTEKEAKLDCVERYERTFGAGSAKKDPARVSRYYYVEEVPYGAPIFQDDEES